MTDSVATVALAPIVQALQPLVIAAVGAAISGIVAIFINLYNNWRWKGTQISAAQAKTIEDAAANEAGKIIAGVDTQTFGNAKVTVSSPVVLAAANNILGADSANLKAALAATGATPERVASLVTGAIGQLQAEIVKGSPPATPAAAAAPAAPANAGA